MVEALGLAASIIAVIDLSAKVVSRCSEYYTNVKNARDDIERLQREAQGLKTILEKAQSMCDGPNGAKFQESQSLCGGVKDCKEQLAQLGTKLGPRTRNKLMSRYGMRALIWPLKSNEVDEIMKKLGNCRDNISFGLQVDQTVNILSIHQEIVLNRLRSADNAVFDSHDEEHNARCYQGTRVELLQEIDNWASDLDSECIFWLNGMAGTGKSTISRTVAQNFADKGDLGASFFFKRGEGDRGHAGLFIATIITQLVQKLPSLAPHVQNAIEADPVITRKALKQQFETLVLQPLGKLRTDPQTSSRMVIVVDALDECDREEDVRIIIRLLSQAKHIKTVQLKFFLTSRPELPIRLGFEDISDKYKGLVLHQIPEPVIKEDISAFLEYELAMIRDDFNKSVKSNRRQLPADWPGQTNVQILVGMAIPLFIFATTVCRFINDRRCGHPNEQLAKVLKYQTKSQASKLDATYLPVLNQLVAGLTNSDRRAIIEGFREVVGSIVILASPLSAISLDLLLEIPEGTVESRTDLLHSVLNIPPHPDIPIRLLHLSFRDFLLDTEKRETNPFWVDERERHEVVSTKCLELLSKPNYLRENMCDLGYPGKPRSEIDSKTLHECLPSDVQYACQYWVHHLEQSGRPIHDQDKVYFFLLEHFLHWLEALSLIGKISNSIALLTTWQLLVTANRGTKLSLFLYDAKRFILQNRWIVDTAPLQLYSSALIFAPETSIIRNTFQDRIPEWISRLPKVPPAWSLEVQKLEGHSNSVTGVAFSSDGQLLASASDDCTVRLWNPTTGEQVQKLEGHSNSVTGVTFSSDDQLLASASYDCTVRLWNPTTGEQVQKLEGHSNSVNSVVFSSDSQLLASASRDRTARLWNPTTGEQVQELKGHSRSVNGVVFSSDNQLLASASGDRTVRLWNPTTGEQVQKLEGHSNSVNGVAFSSDDQLLASASGDCTVRLWNPTTGEQVQEPEGHSGSVNSVVFSSDGQLLASASWDRTVRLWNSTTGEQVQKLKGHSGPVSGVTFSSDSQLLASASWDCTVRLWNPTTGEQAQKLEGHSEQVTSVVFSSDDQLLASVSDDCTVGLWNPTTGEQAQKLEGHSNLVTGVAFSSDGQLLASASRDCTAMLWNPTTGEQVQKLEGHSNSVTGVTFSSDGQLLASASWDCTVRLWNTTTGEQVQELKGHSRSVNGVVFSSDGQLLASASNDCTVRLWNPTTGEQVQKLEGHSNSVTGVTFSSDGQLLASASLDRTVRLWSSTTGEQVQKLELYANISELRFCNDNDYIITDRGTSHLQSTISTKTTLALERPNGIFLNGEWIVRDKKNFLWLPHDYRGRSSSTKEDLLVIGQSSGQVHFIEFSA